MEEKDGPEHKVFTHLEDNWTWAAAAKVKARFSALKGRGKNIKSIPQNRGKALHAANIMEEKEQTDN